MSLTAQWRDYFNIDEPMQWSEMTEEQKLAHSMFFGTAYADNNVGVYSPETYEAAESLYQDILNYQEPTTTTSDSGGLTFGGYYSEPSDEPQTDSGVTYSGFEGDTTELEEAAESVAGQNIYSFDNPVPSVLEGQVNKEQWNAFLSDVQAVNDRWEVEALELQQAYLQTAQDAGTGLGFVGDLSSQLDEESLAALAEMGYVVDDWTEAKEYGALAEQYNNDLNALFEQYGIPQYVERDGRIYYLNTGTGGDPNARLFMESTKPGEDGGFGDYNIQDRRTDAVSFGDVLGAIAEALTLSAVGATFGSVLNGLGVPASLSEQIATNLIKLGTGQDITTGDVLSAVGSAMGFTAPELEEYSANDVFTGEILDAVTQSVQDAFEESTPTVDTDVNIDIDPSQETPIEVDEETGDVTINVPPPVTEEEAGGDQSDSGGSGTPTEEVEEEIIDPNQSTVDEVTDIFEGDVVDTGGGQYEYQGDGVFRDNVDGDLWYVPEVLGVEVGEVVGEDYLIENNATVFESPLGDDTGTNVVEEEVVQTEEEATEDDTGGLTFGGITYVPPQTEEVVVDINADTTSDISDSTDDSDAVGDVVEDVVEDTTEDTESDSGTGGTGGLTFGGYEGGVGTGDGTGDGSGEVDGSIDEGTSTDGTGGGTGDGTGDGSGDFGNIGTGLLGGLAAAGGAFDYQPFMQGISYQPVQIPGLISVPEPDYMAKLDEIISRGLFSQ